MFAPDGGSDIRNVDLNDYITNGIYHYTYGNASTIKNVPFLNMGAVILVLNFSVNGIYQIATDRTASALKKIAIRHYLTNGWSKWMELASSADVLKYKDLPKIETITIGQSGYTRINVPDDAINYLFATVPNWLNNTGAFSICGSMHTFYVVGTPGTVVNNLTVRLWYK